MQLAKLIKMAKYLFSLKKKKKIRMGFTFFESQKIYVEV